MSSGIKKIVAIFLVFGVGLALGLFLAGDSQQTTLDLSELKLKAMASHGNDNFAIATGPVDEDAEGLYTLDFLTGDLNCFVLNVKGGQPSRFTANVYTPPAGFAAKKNKKGSFLMATGQINSPGSPAGRMANSVCYVVDSASGEVIALGFPWNKAQTNTGIGQSAPMILVGKWGTKAGAQP